MNFDADLPIFFADFGVAVSFGAATTKGLLDIHSEDVFGHSEAVVTGLTKTLSIATGSLGLVKLNSIISISSQGNFKIIDLRLEDDGQIQKLYLANANV